MKKGWEKKTLGEVAELRGRIGWRGLTAKEYTAEGPLFLSVHSLNYGDFVDYRDAFHISNKRYEESPEIMLQKDDVLICKDGAGIGKTGIIGDLPSRATINSSLLLVRAGSGIMPKFLYRCLESPYFQSIVQSRLNGATTPHLYQRDIAEFPVVLPPLPEQRRIVAILDEAFEGIAAAKANTENNLRNAREVFESHLADQFSNRGRNWPIARLEDVCGFQGGSQPPKSQFRYQPAKGFVRFLQIRDFASDKNLTYIPESKKNRLCESDDIMLGRYGASVGKVLTGLAGAYNVALIKTIPDESRITKRYLYHYLTSPAFQSPLRQVAARSAQDGFSREDIGGFQLTLPSVPEQSAVVEMLDEVEAECDRLGKQCSIASKCLDELKASLLHQAFTGQL